MVRDLRHCGELVITIIGIVWGRNWNNSYPLLSRLFFMSRCYPYPPPGYEKKAQAELGLTQKKEKHKHKDKKKKRKRDSDANGDSHDKDKRSKKSHRSEISNEVPHSKNGKIVADGIAACSSFPLDNRLQRIDSIQAGSSKSEQISDSSSHDPALYDKRKEGNGTTDGQLHLKIEAPRVNSNGTTAGELASLPESLIARIETESLKQRDSQLIPRTEVWSAIDDQEWLSFSDDQPRSKPRTKPLEDKSYSVWEEAVLLPSVEIYALPYVVPY